MKGAEADGGKHRKLGRVVILVILSLLSYKSALCGRDKSIKVLPLPDAAYRLSWSAYRFSTHLL